MCMYGIPSHTVVVIKHSHTDFFCLVGSSDLSFLVKSLSSHCHRLGSMQNKGGKEKGNMFDIDADLQHKIFKLFWGQRDAATEKRSLMLLF